MRDLRVTLVQTATAWHDPAANRAHFDALLGDLVLGLRDGGGRHAAAVVLGGAQGKAAPPGSDLQQVIVRRQLQLALGQQELHYHHRQRWLHGLQPQVDQENRG